MSQIRKLVKYVLIALGVVATALLGWAAGILKPKHLPDVAGYDIGGFVEAHPLETFVLLLAAAVLVAVLTEAFRRRKQASHEESAEFTPQLRTNLLDLLRARYTKRLEDPAEEVGLDLGLKEIPQALAPNPNLRLVGQRETCSVERGTSIEDLFEDAGGRLLILGEPGSGKTTLLLQLAMKLVQRAEEEDTAPVPVVVNLASWARHGGTIREWLAEALQDAASVSEGLARTLAYGDQLLLLFDGLDEVEAAKRSACIAAINEFVGKGNPAVVCSRTEEYERSEEQLTLEKAVRIEPLEPEQVIRELQIHPGTKGLRTMLHEDERLRELATTPLNVSVMLLAYNGQPATEVEAATKTERRRKLWDDYMTRMLARRPTEYAPENILSWLGWLAEKMRQDNMTDFVPDRMQPTWLDRPSFFRWTVRLVSGLVFGLLVWGLGGWLSGRLFSASVMAYALIAALVWERTEDAEQIQLEENVSWAWDRLVTNWYETLIRGLVSGLAFGLAVWGLVVWGLGGLGLGGWSSFGSGLAFGLALGLVVALMESIDEVRAATMIERSHSLGDRLRASRRNVLIVGPVFGVVFGLVFGLAFGPVLGLVLGLGGGLAFGLFSRGGGEALKFDILRFLLWREGAIPWRYFRFLKNASDLLLLEQVGGTVRFRHLLLRDYFAELTPERIGELAVRIDRRAAT